MTAAPETGAASEYRPSTPGPGSPRPDATKIVDGLTSSVDNHRRRTPSLAVSTAEYSRPILPAWITSPHLAWASIRWRCGRCLRFVAWAAVRSPVLPFRLVPRVGRGAWWAVERFAAWWTAEDVKEALKDEPKANRRRIVIDDAKQTRHMWAGVSALFLAAGTGVLWWQAGDHGLEALGAVILLGLAAAGRREDDKPLLGSPLPPSPLAEGVPLSQLSAAIEDGLPRNLDARVWRIEPRRWGWTVLVQSPKEVTDKHVDDLERTLQTRPGAITAAVELDNASITALSIVHRDPLAKTLPAPTYTPLSNTITRPKPFGVRLDGAPLIIPMIRTHTVLVGGTGSGKSSALTVILDYLTSCIDVIVWGIDLSDGPCLNAWGDCIQRYASDKDEAQAILDDLVDLAIGRTKLLGKRFRPTLAGGPAGSENWQSEDGPTVVLVMDEYPLAVAAGLTGVDTLGRIGRKAGAEFLLAGQGATKENLGTTVIPKMAENKILLPCSAPDIHQLLGPGALKAGWRPDRLKGSANGKPFDAGKTFVQSAVQPDPLISRFYRREPDAARPLAIERMRAGLPQLDPFSAGLIGRRRGAGGLDTIVTAALGAFDGEAISSADLIAHLAAGYADRGWWSGELTDTKLAAALKAAGVVRSRDRIDATTRGWWRADIERALADG